MWLQRSLLSAALFCCRAVAASVWPLWAASLGVAVLLQILQRVSKAAQVNITSTIVRLQRVYSAAASAPLLFRRSNAMPAGALGASRSIY